MSLGFREVLRGFWKAGWAEVGRQAHKSRRLGADCENRPALGTLVAGCPGQGWGNRVSLGSHCQGRCGLMQMQKVLKVWQELLATPAGLGSGAGSLKNRDTVMSGSNLRHPGKRRGLDALERLLSLQQLQKLT